MRGNLTCKTKIMSEEPARLFVRIWTTTAAVIQVIQANHCTTAGHHTILWSALSHTQTHISLHVNKIHMHVSILVSI